MCVANQSLPNSSLEGHSHLKARPSPGHEEYHQTDPGKVWKRSSTAFLSKCSQLYYWKLHQFNIHQRGLLIRR